ncbi:MAG TPA: DUF4440 domain-containing protein [Gemmatimonadaceae bacterium]|nr:DUF4440 domain-containing protein [Gemmatimonadaceae bacterium]
MVRNGFLVAASLLVALGCSPAKARDTVSTATDVTADVAKLKTMTDQWYDFYHKGDAEGIANLYADDAQVLAAGYPAAVGKAAIRTFLAGDIAATKAAGLVDNGSAYNGGGVSGDLGWLSGAYTLSNAAGAVVETGKYTTVFQRMNGEWKIIRDTWNSNVAPAAATSPSPAPPKA